ncbi:MAG: hypothetical protein Salg2KO_00800 [Salibacteraceae bacterium]
MKKNMGSIDKVIRISAAVVVIALYAAGLISGLLAIVLLVVAAAFILTSFIGVCPLYLPFGLSTLRGKKQHKGNE